jgi:DNA-binding GntR family transcriptional regulator
MIAYQFLKEHIVRGEFLPLQHLPAADIAARLEMSRTPVREALRILESEGLVVAQLNRGWTVRPLTRDGIAALWELRAHLEGFAARKAAENVGLIPKHDVEALRNSIAELDDLLEEPERRHLPAHIDAMMAANSRIHEIIIEASGNPRVRSFIGQTVDRGVVYRAWDVFSAAQLRRANWFHQLIVEQVLEGNPGRAEVLMTEHVMQSREGVLARIDAAGGDVSAVFRAPMAAAC